jgi:hypothetical protein
VCGDGEQVRGGLTLDGAAGVVSAMSGRSSKAVTETVSMCAMAARCELCAAELRGGDKGLAVGQGTPAARAVGIVGWDDAAECKLRAVDRLSERVFVGQGRDSGVQAGTGVDCRARVAGGALEQILEGACLYTQRAIVLVYLHIAEQLADLGIREECFFGRGVVWIYTFYLHPTVDVLGPQRPPVFDGRVGHFLVVSAASGREQGDDDGFDLHVGPLDTGR